VGGELKHSFATALKRAEIKDFRFHDLRHTAASWMVMKGVTLPEVKEILGHRDFGTTCRYAHLAPGHLRSAVTRLDGLYPMPVATTAPSEAVHSQADLPAAV
jgi:site-specific recombinase XerD